jgi:hypothetical protein
MTPQRSRALALPFLCSIFLGCGDDSTQTPVGAGGTGPAMGGSSGAGGSIAGVGGTGTSGAGGMPSGGSAGGGKAGSAGGSGAAGAGGSAGANAGASGMGGAGAGASGAAAGGAGGTGGAAAGDGGMGAGASGATGGGGMSAGASGAAGGGGMSAGTSGAAGAGLTSVAQSLHQFRMEAPCIDANHFGSTKQDNCDVAPNVDRQTFQRTIGGSNTTTYDVTLRVRGLTEPNIYTGGTLNPPRFYVGGRTTQAGYTAYSLSVTDPPQVYFFNHDSSVGHFVFQLDYEVVIPMRGGTTVTFDVNGQSSVPDGHGVSNRDSVVVAGVPPAPDPFNGQFVQFDVVDVTVRN